MSKLIEALNESFNIDESVAIEEPFIEKKEIVEESQEPLKESLSKSPLDIIEEYEMYTTKQGMTRKEAVDKISSEMSENLTESVIEEEVKPVPQTRAERLKEANDNRMRKFVEDFKKDANFPLDEELDDEKLKYQDMRIKTHAVRHGIPSAKFREMLIKGI